MGYINAPKRERRFTEHVFVVAADRQACAKCETQEGPFEQRSLRTPLTFSFCNVCILETDSTFAKAQSPDTDAGFALRVPRTKRLARQRATEAYERRREAPKRAADRAKRQVGHDINQDMLVMLLLTRSLDRFDKCRCGRGVLVHSTFERTIVEAWQGLGSAGVIPTVRSWTRIPESRMATGLCELVDFLRGLETCRVELQGEDGLVLLRGVA